jgi:hypothetical protein
VDCNFASFMKINKKNVQDRFEGLFVFGRVDQNPDNVTKTRGANENASKFKKTLDCERVTRSIEQDEP